jgi:hypothetical protein
MSEHLFRHIGTNPRACARSVETGRTRALRLGADRGPGDRRVWILEVPLPAIGPQCPESFEGCFDFRFARGLARPARRLR